MFRFAQFFGIEEVHNEMETVVDEYVQTDLDDDWILIDIGRENEDNGNEIGSEINELPIHESSNTSLVPHTADTQCQHECDNSDRSDMSQSPVPVQVMMEESWFVTPPPCFVNHSNNSITIETTPFENLLIEHPSMSVFGPSLPRSFSLSSLPSSSSSSPSPSSDASSNSGLNREIQINTKVQSQRTSRRQKQQQQTRNASNSINQNTANFTSRAVVFNEWRSVMNAMQTAETAQYQKFKTKAHMNRQNKVYVQRNHTPNRKMKMFMKPNGVYNNRKNC